MTVALVADESSGQSRRSGGAAAVAMAMAAPIRVRKPLTEEQKEARALARAKRKREEEEHEQRVRDAREKRMLEERQRKWDRAGYASTNLAEPSEDEDEEEDLADEDAAPLHYEFGDATRPLRPATGPAIIVHVVDNSGRWGHGGLFTSLARMGPAAESAYTTAHDMDDLHLGDAHVVAMDMSRPDGSPLYAALIVAQRRTRAGMPSEIMLDALGKGLARLAAYAAQTGASVHLPRIGHRTPNFNWYGVERILRKCLTAKRVPAAIYYFKAARRSTAPVDSPDSKTPGDGQDPQHGRTDDEAAPGPDGSPGADDTAAMDS
eukprot:m.165228 g.165228  ORF g.165228 m.165228 type:complete len:320 (-) comp9892_c0_seq33:1065-2024(-)